MESPSFNEKRNYTRFEVNIPVNYFVHDQSEPVYYGVTQDISSTGLGILATDKIEQGARVDVCLQVPDNEYLKLTGRVIWTGVTEEGKYRIGIELDGEQIKPVPILLKVVRAHNSF